MKNGGAGISWLPERTTVCPRKLTWPRRRRSAPSPPLPVGAEHPALGHACLRAQGPGLFPDPPRQALSGALTGPQSEEAQGLLRPSIRVPPTRRKPGPHRSHLTSHVSAHVSGPICPGDGRGRAWLWRQPQNPQLGPPSFGSRWLRMGTQSLN